MLTKKQQQILLQLLAAVQISGTREQVMKTMAELDTLTKTVEQLPTIEEEKPGKEKNK